jgi:hypothetical protein
MFGEGKLLENKFGNQKNRFSKNVKPKTVKANNKVQRLSRKTTF